jgi:endonuclease YncB( thermonuclease family)
VGTHVSAANLILVESLLVVLVMGIKLRFIFTFLALFILVISLSFAQTKAIEGITRVIDGDTLKIGKNRIRLHGIDAPEAKQLCRDKKLNDWLCGQAATKALTKKIDNRVVQCLPDKKDRYKRYIAVCSVDGENLNQWLVLNGWAVAYRKYSKDYISAEAIAKSRKPGIWSGEFILPWKWRRGKRLR